MPRRWSSPLFAAAESLLSMNFFSSFLCKFAAEEKDFDVPTKYSTRSLFLQYYEPVKSYFLTPSIQNL